MGADMKRRIARRRPAAVGAALGDAALQRELRTTCVATLLEGGHAMNALPQLAQAPVNCRVLPGESIESVKAHLVRAVADEKSR